MPDLIEKIGQALIQHGPLNDRIYLMRLDSSGIDVRTLLARLEGMALSKGYGKIIAKIPQRYRTVFCECGYRCEAVIPGYYQGNESCCFAARFLSPERASEPMAERLREVLASAQRTSIPRRNEPSSRFHVVDCSVDDAASIAGLYQKVFPSYPFPIQDRAYIESAMSAHTAFFGIRTSDSLAAVASLEVDPHNRVAEMADFATLPHYRSQGMAEKLLHRMDDIALQGGMRTVYSIARAGSIGMNRTFYKCGYQHAGLLVNNTHISGAIQSMNVWFKSLE